MKGVFNGPGRLIRWIDRQFWMVVVIAHLTAAPAWWWLMPGGFPLNHPRFWLNRVFPIVLFVAMLIVRIPRLRGRHIDDLRFAIRVGLATFWIVMSVALLIVFPITFRFRFLLPLAVGAWMAVSLRRELTQTPRNIPARFWIISAIGFVIGGLFPTWEHALPAATRPLAASSNSVPRTNLPPRDTLQVDANAKVLMRSSEIEFTNGLILLRINPMLTFGSVSPDGCFSLFTPNSYPRVSFLSSRYALAQADSGLKVFSGRGSAEIFKDLGDGTNRIVANTQVPMETWSHLNTYAEMTIAGHKKLSLSFSPCPEAHIEVMPMDYPFGRPARFAYLDDQEVFHVVEASSAEKGPFHTLASGKMMRGEALTITFFDQDRAVYRVKLDDWARQCSTQLSSTAGWGVPENSIEFSLEGNAANAPASIFITLAATSVGRGFDTVGHKPGTYRNALTVERINPSPATSPQ